MAITNSALPLVLRRASEVWPGSMTEKDFVAHIDTLRALKDQQTAQLQYVNLPDGVDARIAWINQCDLTVDTLVTTDCSFTGQEADTYNKDISINQAKQTTFSVPLDAWRDNLFGFADAVAVNLNKAMIAQAEAVAQYAVGVIEANLGTNTYDNGGKWTVSGTSNSVPGAEWESTAIFGKFQILARKNRFNNPFILSGENLYQLAYMARTSAGNGEGKGDFQRINEMPIYNDIWNVDTVNTPALKSYVIERGTFAFLSKGYYPMGEPEVLNGNFQRFSMKNRFFPELIHDVETLVDCSSGVWKQHWKVIPRYKVEINPTGCTTTRTGVVALTNEGV
jgi:hypothetical protein